MTDLEGQNSRTYLGGQNLMQFGYYWLHCDPRVSNLDIIGSVCDPRSAI